MQRLWRFVLAVAVLALSSCADRGPKAGHALLEIDLENIHAGRVGNPVFTSHHGNSISRRTRLDLAPGKHEVDFQYKLNGHEQTTTTLVFEAQADQRYQVRFDLFPIWVDNKPWDRLASADAGEGGAFILPFELAIRSSARGLRNLSGNMKEVKWAYIDVISDKLEEGIVFRVKVPE